jgi:hypothetical protein
MGLTPATEASRGDSHPAQTYSIVITRQAPPRVVPCGPIESDGVPDEHLGKARRERFRGRMFQTVRTDDEMKIPSCGMQPNERTERREIAGRVTSPGRDDHRNSHVVPTPDNIHNWEELFPTFSPWLEG